MAIGDFIAREAPQYAQMVVDGIIASVDRLESFPLSGRIVPEIEDDALREILYRGYRVIHVISSADGGLDVKILTVIHSSLTFDE